MTKTKKIVCIALALLMIAGAVFFAIYNKVGKTFKYDKIKNYDKYITIGDVIGLTFYADDCEIDVPDDGDVYAEVAKNLRAFTEVYPTEEDENNTKVTDPAAVIGSFDVAYVNYYGTYVDDEDQTHYFFIAKDTETKKGLGPGMDKDNPIALYVDSGDSSLYFATRLKGKSPDPDAYTLKAAGDESVIDADDVIYITYTRVRYPYETDEDGNRVKDEEDKDTVGDKTTETTVKDVRLDLANPAGFPAGFADAFIGKKVGESIETLTFENVEIDLGKDNGGVQQFRCEYTVTVDRVIENFNGIDLDFTFSDDATEKDQDGNELKGKNVTFHVAIAYFEDVPELTRTYPVDPDDEDSAQESILFAKLKFDQTDYYKNKVEDDYEAWKLQNENLGKTREDYDRYLIRQYVAMIRREKQDEYDQDRMEVAAKPLWDEIKKQVTEVNPPKRALKLTRSDLLSEFKYYFNNGSFEKNGKSVSYRTEYGSFKKFMAACYADADMKKALGLDTNAAYTAAIDAKKSWSECIDEAVKEIVTNKLLIYALSDRFGSAVRVRGSVFETERNNMYLYYYLGYYDSILPDTALRESIMFDNVMKYIYDRANVQWDSDGAIPNT